MKIHLVGNEGFFQAWCGLGTHNRETTKSPSKANCGNCRKAYNAWLDRATKQGLITPKEA